MEGAAGHYPVTEAFLRLTAALLEAGHTCSTTRAYVAHALTAVLPRHACWRYVSASAGQRWRIGAAAVRVLRLALSAAPDSAQAEGAGFY